MFKNTLLKSFIFSAILLSGFLLFPNISSAATLYWVGDAGANEIIYISKAFELDENREIIEDIYDQVRYQDNDWATIEQNNYVRVTFEQILDNTKDITIYARPSLTSGVDETTPEVLTIEVYTENGTEVIATFENIDHEDTYKIYLTNLQTPTDVFDLRVIASGSEAISGVDIDYIVDPVGWLTGWSYRKKITISNTNVDADLTDFPTLVSIAETGGGSTNIGYNVSDTTNGYDIRFTNSGGTTLLAYERESFAVASANLTANFWVKVPAIDDAVDTDIYIYYTNASANTDWTAATSTLTNCTTITNVQCVWKEGATQNFAGVWHLKETGTNPTVNDSTSNANNSTAQTWTPTSSGQVDGGGSFNSSNISIPSQPGLHPTGAMTISALANLATSPPAAGVLAGTMSMSDRGYWIALDGTDVYFDVPIDSTYYFRVTKNRANASNEWHYWVGVYIPSTSLTIYRDGALDVQNTTSVPASLYANTQTFRIGIRSDDDYPFKGSLDEVRVSSTARSAAWVKFEYNNMNSANAELTYAAQEGSTPTNAYWIGGTGNWSDTSHWANESGGTGGYSPPGVSSNVYFDASSGTGTVTIDTASVSVAGYTNSTANITVSLGSNTLNVSGNFANTAGGFTAGTGTVTLNGTSQTISGSTTFYNLTKTVAAADTLTITAGTTQTIAAGGKLTLRGASAQLLTLASSTTSAYTITLNATSKYVVDYLSVSYSTATGLGIVALNSTNGGNNTGWTFQTTSGTLRYWIATTTANWNSTANWSTTSGGSGGSSVPTTTSDAIFDGNANGNATVDATVSVKGMYLAGYTGAISQGSYAITIGADNYAQGTGTFTGGSAAITLNGTYTLSGGTFTSTSGTITTASNWTVSGGTFNANGGTLQLFTAGSQSLTITGSQTFNNLTIGGAYYGDTLTIAVGTTLTVNGTLNFAGSYIVTYATPITVNNGTIEAKGDITQASVGAIGTTALNISGTGAQTFTGGGADAFMLPLTINKSSGTLTLSGTISTGKDWTYTAGTVNAGTSTVKFRPDYSTTITISGSQTLNNVIFSVFNGTFNMSSGTILTVNGTLTFTYYDSREPYITINTGTIEAKGDIEVTSGSIVQGTASLLIDGTGDQTFTGNATATSGNIIDININKTSGTLYLVGTIRIGNDWTYTAGTINAGTSTVVFGGGLAVSQTITGSHTLNNVTMVPFEATITIASGTTLTVGGTLTFDGTNIAVINTGTIAAKGDITIADTISYAGTATLLINGTGDQTFTDTGGSGTLALNPITINKSSGSVILATAASFNNSGQDLTITSGTLDLAGYNLTVNDQFTIGASGTLKLKGTAVQSTLETVTGGPDTLSAGSTVVYYGTNGPYTLKNWSYSNLQLSAATATTYTAPAAMSLTGNLTVDANNTFDPGGFLITGSGTNVLTNSGTLLADNTTFGASYTSWETRTMSSGSTVNYSRAGDQTIDNTLTYVNLTTSGSGTKTLGGTTTVSGNLTHTAGTIATSTYALNVAGNWVGNSNAVTGSGAGAVVLNGTTQTVSGSTTFYNLTIDKTNIPTISFTSGTTQTISGDFTATGDATHQITIGATTTSAAILSKTTGTVSVSYCTISYSTAQGGAAWQAYTTNGNVNGGNNSGWVFSANNAPAFTAGPSDGSSSSTTPTNAGANVTFTATASDTQNDNYYLAICKTDAITANNNAAPTCATSQTWCVSGSTAHDVPASCNYLTSSGSAESNVWYAFVCDYNASSACSASSQGSTSPSPFAVNRPPSFTAIADGTDPIAVGQQQTFTSTSSDSDTDGSADTVTLYTCRSNDFIGSACGSAGEWCHSTASASNASCNYTILSGDGLGTKNYFSYIIDNHSFASTSNPLSGTFTISGTGGASYIKFSGNIKFGGNLKFR